MMIVLPLVLLVTTAFAKPTLKVFVISDFSLSFVRPSSSFDRSLLPSGQFICPPSAYPDALTQFQFTSDFIAGVQKDIPMSIQYYAYSGGDGDPIDNVFSNRDNFTESSIPAYTNFCAEGPEENDFERFIKLTITPSINTELLIIITAAPQGQVDKALPINSSHVNQTIVLGLKGTSASNAYPKSAVTLSDFSEPERVSCMIDALYETIHDKVSEIDAVELCYPQPEPNTQETSTITTTTTTTPPPTTTDASTAIPTTESPPRRVLFINDFTTDFIKDDQSFAPAKQASNSIKCPMNMHPEAGAQFDFTNAIIQGISDDIRLEIYYYAYNGDGRLISNYPLTKDTFAYDTEFKDVVCMDSTFYPSDLSDLATIIDVFSVELDTIVLFSASTQADFDQVFPLDSDAAVIVVGMSEASASNAYPTTATNIDDFSQPEVITCMVEATFSGNENPVDTCGAPTPKQPMSILFVNDFTTNFVGDDDAMVKKITTSKAIYGKCPGGMYPAAGNEFNYTVDIVNSIRMDANLNLMLTEYTGSNYEINIDRFGREFFAEEANNVFRDACFDDHVASDLMSFAETCLYEVSADVLVLFTTEQLYQPLPYISSNYARIIVVGLNGADPSIAYPDSSISIADFSKPKVVACMIDRLWDNISDPALLSCVN